MDETALTSESSEERPTRPRHVRTVLVLCGLALVPGSGASAQQVVERIDDQLALARVCASEIGFGGAPDECAAIHDVLSRRASRWDTSLSWAARTYSNRVFDRDRRDGRAYIAHLRPDGRRPEGWPEVTTVRRGGASRVVRHAPWGAFRERWLGLYEAAGRIVRGEIRSPCRDAVDHWGMRHGVDMERARRAGWLEVDCGPTRNAFWHVPRAQEG